MTYFNIRTIEKYFTLFVFISLVLLPAVEVIARFFGTTGVIASSVLVQHLTLWIGFAGAVIAARRNKLLSLTTEPLFKTELSINWFNFIGKVTTIFIVLALAYGSWELVKIEMDYPVDIAPLLPRWAAQFVMPVGFFLIAIHLLINGYASWKNRSIMLFGITSIILLTR
ncbi:MAG TPA: TRAP transporter small permease, partial [Candidatus Marinimicrobia bacterium]|nr:TRAP transporter small permease [Candidatus Neomarinimicrobiota bacterium]